ncbi:MAG: hypothetical protein V4671_24575 [Armatimonadota bacterium]
MPNSTVKAYKEAVIATVAAADLTRVDEDKAPLTPEQAKARLTLKDGLKKIGGTLLDDETCPECGSTVALLPKDGHQYKVCTEQFKDDPGCWWSELQKKKTPADPEK